MTKYMIMACCLMCVLLLAGSAWAQADPAAMARLSAAVPTKGVVRARFENPEFQFRVDILFDFASGAFSIASNDTALMRAADGNLWKKHYDAKPAETWKPTSFPPEAILRTYMPVVLLRWVVQNPSSINQATVASDGSVKVNATVPVGENNPSYTSGATRSLDIDIDANGRVVSVQWAEGGKTSFAYPETMSAVAWIPLASGEAPGDRAVSVETAPAPTDIRSYAANMLSASNAVREVDVANQPTPSPQSIPTARPSPNWALILTGSVVLMIAVAAWWKRRA